MASETTEGSGIVMGIVTAHVIFGGVVVAGAIVSFAFDSVGLPTNDWIDLFLGIVLLVSGMILYYYRRSLRT